MSKARQREWKGWSWPSRADPDLVLLDLGLPDLDGADLLRMIRSVSHVPVIVITARGADSVVVSTLDAGADDYLVKPFSVSQLEARVRRYCGRRADSPTLLSESEGSKSTLEAARPDSTADRWSSAPKSSTSSVFLSRGPERSSQSGSLWPRCGVNPMEALIG